MRPPVLHLRLLLTLAVLLFFGAGTRALGKVSLEGEKPHYGDFFAEVLTRAGSPAAGTEERIRETASWSGNFAPDVEDGPNLYAYVNQNPWSAFDPEGLKTVKDYRKELNSLVDEKQGNLVTLREIMEREDKGTSEPGDYAVKIASIGDNINLTKQIASTSAKINALEAAFNIARSVAKAQGEHISPAYIQYLDDESSEFKAAKPYLDTARSGTFIAENYAAGKIFAVAGMAIRGIVGTAATTEGRFVYRGLAKGENPAAGLTARAPGAGNSELSHVAGKRQTQWISTTKDQATAVGKYGENGAVRIDLNKVNSNVSDVSGGFPKGGQMSNWAKKDQEVLIQDFIPAEAIERIK